jgi:hypothetical protein
VLEARVEAIGDCNLVFPGAAALEKEMYLFPERAALGSVITAFVTEEVELIVQLVAWGTLLTILVIVCDSNPPSISENSPIVCCPKLALNNNIKARLDKIF